MSEPSDALRNDTQDAGHSPENPGAIVETPASASTGRAWLIVSCLVAVLAAATIAIECFTRICSLFLFNPVPTLMHLAMLITVPMLLAATAVCIFSKRTARRERTLLFVNGWLLGVGGWYAGLFLPFMPFAALAVLHFGLGLPPLAPACVLITAICQGLALPRSPKAAASGRRAHPWFAGLLLALVPLGGWQYYVSSVNRAVTTASTWNAGDDQRDAGLRRLRQLRAEQYLLARSFDPSNVYDVSPWDFRIAYYLLTGRDYREAGTPSRFFHFFSPPRDNGMHREFDNNEASALLLRSAVCDLSVASADGGGNAGPGVAHAEFTFELANLSSVEREARCQFIMPPGAVASRLTFWIDGEEREAGFDACDPVRKASKKSPTRPLGPALLVSSGPGRVRLHCSPIMPHGSVRVKVGVSLPLFPDAGQAHLTLPYIVDANFAVSPVLAAALRAECDAPFTVGKAVSPPVENGSVSEDDSGKRRKAYVVRGSVLVSDLPAFRLSLPLPPSPASYQAAFPGFGAASDLVSEKPIANRLAAIVLDGNPKLAPVWSAPEFFRDVLKHLSPDCRVALFCRDIALPPLSAEDALREWPKALAALAGAGADNQLRNLQKAWDLCEPEADAAVLWIHGPMPLIHFDASGMRQRLERRPPSGSGPVVYSAQVLSGVNGIENALASSGLLRLPVRLDQPIRDEVARLLGNLHYPAFARDRYRYRLLGETTGTNDRYGDVVRLALAAAIAASPIDGQRKHIVPAPLVDAALRLGIVTPATSAGAIERPYLYGQATIDSKDKPNRTPARHEPSDWAMPAIIGGGLLPFQYFRQKRQMRP